MEDTAEVPGDPQARLNNRGINPDMPSSPEEAAGHPKGMHWEMTPPPEKRHVAPVKQFDPGHGT